MHWDDTTINYDLGKPFEGYTDKERKLLARMDKHKENWLYHSCLKT